MEEVRKIISLISNSIELLRPTNKKQFVFNFCILKNRNLIYIDDIQQHFKLSCNAWRLPPRVNRHMSCPSLTVGLAWNDSSFIFSISSLSHMYAWYLFFKQEVYFYHKYIFQLPPVTLTQQCRIGLFKLKMPFSIEEILIDF